MITAFSELELLATYKFNSMQPILLDVGAHQGGFSRVFAEKGWRILAFEPERNNRKAFVRNLAGFQQVNCVAKAVTDVAGEIVPFYVSEVHYGIHSLKPFHKTHRLAYEVETVCLNNVLEELQIPSVALVKVDTEGADFLALKGLNFKRYSPELVMTEFMDDRSMPNFGYDHHDVVAYMKGFGYVAFVSEWAPIKEYGREGVASEPHEWLQCLPYPLDHDPAWGNLIFVSEKDRDKFSATLESFLFHLKLSAKIDSLEERFGKFPGAGIIIKFIRNNTMKWILVSKCLDYP